VNGSNYFGLNLASFRGSSELEYGTDSTFLFVADEAGGITLQCGKNRYGPVADRASGRHRDQIRFDDPNFRFGTVRHRRFRFRDARPS
jgi:hypothetical protein